MKTRTKRFWAMLLMIVMILGTVPTSVFGENTPDSASCIVVKADAPAAATVSAGGLYKLNLETVFGDTEGHSLTYGFNTTVKNEHTKLAGSVFYFSSPEMGEYDVVLTAACSGGKELSHTLKMTVEKANEGIAAQYGYEETKKDSVTVKVTVSNDGYPILGSDEDETVLSHLEVTVPYFDLALYGLEDFYRYGTENGRGIYVNENLIERPTGLHLYIYLLERYYMGLPEEQCGKGTSGVLNYAKDIDVSYMNDAEAYSSDGKQALLTTGGATSIYMTNFWGHDENLMYFRNHCYPYMSPGWGATSDYILLSDGDTWDVAMFTDWNFYLRGYFARFDKDEYTAEPEAELTVKTQGWGTGSEAKEFQAKNELSVALYDSEWNEVGTLSYDSEDSNSITFKAPKAAGTYYLMAVDPDAATEEACIAPATAVLTVKEAAKECDECKDEDGNRICDECKKNFNFSYK